MCEFVINLKEILRSFDKAKSFLSKKTKMCVVVKANAYGFGAPKICQLLNIKADYFAVARLSEFLKIENIAKKPVLILSPLFENEMKVAIEKGAELSIDSIEMLICANKIAGAKHKIAKVHLVLDTGMNRFGIKQLSELERFLCVLKEMKNVRLIGAYSHVYDATDAENVKLQREKFIAFKEVIIKNGFNPIFHFASSVPLKDKENQFDMVRLGFDEYYSETAKHMFVARVLETKQVFKGEKISYSGTFVASKDMKIAICSAGYADGLPRKMSNMGEVLICGQKVPIVGRVCMDVFMCDISNVLGAKVGEKVVIFGCQKESSISVCQVAEICDTIAYEIYTGITERVKRVYKWR